jgi:rubrerythrin
MGIYEYAMQMELEGKAWYEERAAKTQHPGLRKILLAMAEDEDKHYQVFAAMSRNEQASMAQPSTVLEQATSFFQDLSRAGAPEFDATEITLWEELRAHEEKAEQFYREKAAAAATAEEKTALEQIAEEEHRHSILIDNMIEFLRQPEIWLENAEWRHLEAY